MRFTDSDGLRVTAFITDTPPGVVPGQLGGLELRHRQHARVEDRIRQAKATGLANLPCHRFDANAARPEIILAETDLVAWTKLIGLPRPHRSGHLRDRHLPLPRPARRGPHHPSARKVRLRIDATWRWATAICQAWQRLRAAFPDHPAHPSIPTQGNPALESPPTDRRRTTRHTHLQQSTPEPGQRRPATTHDGRAQDRG